MTTPHQSRLMDRWAEGIPAYGGRNRSQSAGGRARLRHDVGIHAFGDAGPERHDPYGRGARLGDAHDRPRTDGTARTDARGDAGHRHQRYVARAERAEGRQTPSIRRAYLGYHRRFRRRSVSSGRLRPTRRLPFAGPLRFSEGDRFGPSRRRTPTAIGSARRRTSTAPWPAGFWRPACDPIAGQSRNLGCGDCLSWNAVYSSTPNVETLRLPSASTVMPYSPVSTPFRMMR